MIQEKDILISKVRTYRKGIGYVDKEGGDLVCTPAFFIVRDVSKQITKEYLYSILRNDFFTEQILSLQNRGMYPRLDKDTKKEVLIPIPKDKKIIKYITELTKSVIKKLRKQRDNFEAINRLIEEEIKNNQKATSFHYKLPSFQELKKIKRLSASIYSEEYNKLIFLIQNYKCGFFNINPQDFLSGNTPKKRLFGVGKIWITPTNISILGTTNKDFILCENYNISKDCVLMVNRGREEDVGVSMFYDLLTFGEGQHNQGIYRVEGRNKKDLIVISCLLNSKIYRRICANLSLGSKMDEMKIIHFSKLPFPNLPKSKKEEIINLYYKNKEYNSPNLFNFSKKDNLVTCGSGILQLNEQIIRIQDKLDKIIDDLINDRKIKIEFEFLNK